MQGNSDTTVVAWAGDGGTFDIGLQALSGAAERNEDFLYVCLDNEGYMNTGAQLSYSTPIGNRTSTSEVGKADTGKRYHHKDTAQIFTACHIPYVCTVAESNPRDMVRKAAKAQKYADEQGLVFVKMISMCPLAWRTEERVSVPIIQAAVDCCFFPLYEVENGITTLNYDPEEKGKKVPVTEWLKQMGKTRHMLKPDCKPELDRFQAEVDRLRREEPGFEDAYLSHVADQLDGALLGRVDRHLAGDPAVDPEVRQAGQGSVDLGEVASYLRHQGGQL